MLSIVAKGKYMQPAPPSDGSGHRTLTSQPEASETTVYFNGKDIGGEDGAVRELVKAIHSALEDQTSNSAAPRSTVDGKDANAPANAEAA